MFIFGTRPGYTENPHDVLSYGIKDIQSKGYGITTPKKFTLHREFGVSVRELITDIPISENDVKFVCNETDLCGPGKPLEIDTAQIRVNQNTVVYGLVCGNEDNPSPGPKFCVSIASEAQKAVDACLSKETGCNVE